MAMSTEHRSKSTALHRQWWRLQMSEKFSSGTKKYIQTNKQTNIEARGVRSWVRHLIDLVLRDDPCMKQVPVVWVPKAETTPKGAT